MAKKDLARCFSLTEEEIEKKYETKGGNEGAANESQSKNSRKSTLQNGGEGGEIQFSTSEAVRSDAKGTDNWTDAMPSAPLLDENSSSAILDANAINSQIRQRKLKKCFSNKINDVHSDWKVETYSEKTEEQICGGFEDDLDVIVTTAEDDYQRPAKLDLLVGFLRFILYLSACTAVFGICLSIYFPLSGDFEGITSVWFQLNNEKRKALGNYDWIFVVKEVAGIIQLVYLVLVTVFILIDSVATLTFRWKEYGELTHRHTDSTSILFLISKWRWKLRLLCVLTIISSLSLHTTQIILSFYGRELEDLEMKRKGLIFPHQVSWMAFHAVVWYISLITASIPALLIGYLLHFIPYRFRDVPWLDNRMKSSHIDDKGDTWKIGREIAIQKVSHISKLVEKTVPDFYVKNHREPDQYEMRYRRLSCLGQVMEAVNKVTCFICYVCSIAMNLQGLLLMDLTLSSFEFWTVTLTGSSTIIISLYLVLLICIQGFRSPPRTIPYHSRFFVPFVLSAGTRLLLDLCSSMKDQRIYVFIYLTLMAVFLLVQIMAISIQRLDQADVGSTSFCQFISFNFFTSEGAYKKVVRFLDTLGSCLVLIGLILGLTSVFVDQYDLDFEPQGELKVVNDILKDVSKGMRKTQETLKSIIKKFDFNVTCEHIYSSIATGSLAVIFLSLVPGASSAANMGSKTAMYSVRVGSALSKLARILKASAKKLWDILKVIKTVSKITVSGFSKFTIGSGSITLLRLLPFLPPVVIGIHILFSAFWPKRVLFFSAKQRRKFINGQFLQWLLAIILLILALSINTALVDEVVRVFDENLPLVRVYLERKLGWRLSIAASSFAIGGSFSYFLAYLVLKIKTDQNHDNLTNEEKDWASELEKRQLVSFNTPFGQKIEKRNQIRYKKERINGSTWFLPIILCLIACCFGILANLYPKIDMYREPKGVLGKTMDKILTKISFYEDDMRRAREYGEMECLPFQTFGNVLSERLQYKSNILMNPINAFFNKTEELFSPLKQVLSRTRKQFVADIGDDLFGKEVVDTIYSLKLLDLRYLGMLLLIPRLLNLLILIFGMLTMSVATCRMIICEAVEPRKIVAAFGAVTMFSAVFVIGAQMALFNILQDFGIPFYRITVRYGLGFVYDLVSECIMISIYIGMKNEFFFAIPKRKVTVTYAVPGVSDEGPNIRGQII